MSYYNTHNFFYEIRSTFFINFFFKNCGLISILNQLLNNKHILSRVAGFSLITPMQPISNTITKAYGIKFLSLT